MSAATVTTAPVTGVVATSASDAPFTVTAAITDGTAGRKYLAVIVDGKPTLFSIDPARLKLYREHTLTDEAERLLQRHRALRTVNGWTEGENGELRADVAPFPGYCPTCAHGCFCEPGSKGCGHYGCWAATDANADTCDGAQIHLAAPRPRRLARRGGRR